MLSVSERFQIVYLIVSMFFFMVTAARQWRHNKRIAPALFLCYV